MFHGPPASLEAVNPGNPPAPTSSVTEVRVTCPGASMGDLGCSSARDLGDGWEKHRENMAIFDCGRNFMGFFLGLLEIYSGIYHEYKLMGLVIGLDGICNGI